VVRSFALFFAPPGLVSFPLLSPRLAPLRQAQGRLWAAFLRRFAANGSGSGTPQRNSLRGQIGRRVGPLSQQRWVTILLGPSSSWGQAIWHQASRYFSQGEVPRPWG